MDGRRWNLDDREGNSIYLTNERWDHICHGHPELAGFEAELQVTLRSGRRRQEPLNPRKYRYVQAFDHLPGNHSHIVTIVLFTFDVDEEGRTLPNNFVATAYMKHIRA